MIITATTITDGNTKKTVIFDNTIAKEKETILSLEISTHGKVMTFNYDVKENVHTASLIQ